MKDYKIEIRVSEEEKNKIIEKAKISGLSISEYVRRVSLNKEIKARFSEEEKMAWNNLTYISQSLKNLGNILSKDNRDELVKEIKKINEQIKLEILKFLK